MLETKTTQGKTHSKLCPIRKLPQTVHKTPKNSMPKHDKTIGVFRSATLKRHVELTLKISSQISKRLNNDSTAFRVH